MSLLLSNPFIPAYWPIVSSLILCMILLGSVEGRGGGGGASLSKLLFLHSENGSTLKGKRIFPLYS